MTQAHDQPKAVFAHNFPWLRTTLTQAPELPLRAPPAPFVLAEREVRLRVERNFPFEFVLRPLQSAAALWRAGIRCELSHYDISLAGLETHNSGAAFDALLCWIDWRLLNLDEQNLAQQLDIFAARFAQVAQITGRPLIINDWFCGTSALDDRLAQLLHAALKTLAAQNPRITLLSLHTLQRAHKGIAWFDARNDEIGKMPLSSPAMNIVARHLGKDILPRVLGYGVRLIIVDADDTLYCGTLGEDGSANVTLTQGHHALQHKLRDLKQDGVLLALLSRNEPGDVQKLFASREDFPLRWEDFATSAISWQPKLRGAQDILARVNLSAEHAIFIDDNISELLNFEATDLALHLAAADATLTCRALAEAPGVWGHKSADAHTNALRTRDLQAAEARRELLNHTDGAAKFESLGLALHYGVNDESHTARAAELSQKTNQFNLALMRQQPADLRAWAAKPAQYVLTVAARDVLADSGIIGMATASCTGPLLRLTELCMSCRAMGRSIEDLWLLAVLRRFEQEGCEQVCASTCEGPRNMPARSWAEKIGLSAEPNDIACIIAKLAPRVESLKVAQTGGLL